VVELGCIRIKLCRELPRIALKAALPEVELDVVAVGADDGLSKAGGFITPRPVERGLEDYLFGGITLRFVRSRRRVLFSRKISVTP
jgi:hypothetical protein